MSKENFRFENEGSKASLFFLKKLETILEDKIPSVLGYQKSDLIFRWCQLFVEENLSQMKRDLVGHSDGKEFKSKSYKVNLHEKTIKIPCKIWLNHFFTFNAYLFSFYFIFLKSFVTNLFRKSSNQKYIIFDNYDLESTIKNELSKDSNFFNQGPIKIFNEKSQVIIATNGEVWQAKNFMAVQKPLITLLKKTKFCFGNLIRFKLSMIAILFKVNWLFITNPIMSVFSKDFSFHWLVDVLNRKEVISDYIITNSYLLSHRISFTKFPGRKFTSHMIWYSVNSRPYVFKEIKDDEIFAPPLFRYVSVDQHWVWNQDQADWIKEVCAFKHDSHIVGPIMFFLPTGKSIAKDLRKKVVTIFDVTPIRDDHLKDQQGLHGYNYYNAQNCYDFLSQTVEVLHSHFGDKLVLRIKPKRTYKDIHDKRYIELITDLQKKGQLIVLEPTSNIFDVIRESDVVVSIPFSSPSLIAQFEKVPSILFDASGILINDYADMEQLMYVSGKNEFKNLLRLRF